MELVSQTMVKDRGLRKEPLFPKKYTKPDGFNLGAFKEWQNGQPWDYYKKLHAQAPIAWMPPVRRGEDGFWAIADYQAIQACALDATTFSSMRGGVHMSTRDMLIQPKKIFEAACDNFLNLDAPFHPPIRSQLRSFFTPKYIEKIREQIEGRVTELFDKMEAEAKAGDGTVDFVKMFSAQLPVYAVCEILGINTAENRKQIMDWMWYFEQTQSLTYDKVFLMTHPQRMVGAMRSARELFEFGGKLGEERRRNPQDDLMTKLSQLEYEGEPLPKPYLDGGWFLVVFAANDTTKNTLTGTVKLLSENPDQRELVLQDRGLMQGMIDESIRMVSPVIHMRRTATCDTEVLGQKIGENEKVIYYYGAANRDPKVFENPDRFDIRRENANKSLAFGYGPHMCLGKILAMAQLNSAFNQLLDRFPNFKVEGKETIQRNNFVSACTSMRVRLNA